MINNIIKIISVAFISCPVLASNTTLFNTDLLSNSCLKTFHKYHNCNFSNYTNKSLTNTKQFTLPMEFKVEYSRGICGSQFVNGKFQEGNFKLKVTTNLESKSFFPGNFRTKLQGNQILLTDEDPWITQNVSFLQPCRLIIRNMDIDFTETAKAQIAGLIENKNASKNLSQQREIINYNITEIKNAIVRENYENLSYNINELLIKLNSLNDPELLSPQQTYILESIINRVKNESNNKEKKLSHYILNRLNNTLDIVSNKLSDKLNKIEFINQYDNEIKLENVLFEVQNEPYFNKASLDELIKQIKS